MEDHHAHNYPLTHGGMRNCLLRNARSGIVRLAQERHQSDALDRKLQLRLGQAAKAPTTPLQ